MRCAVLKNYKNSKNYKNDILFFNHKNLFYRGQ